MTKKKKTLRPTFPLSGEFHLKKPIKRFFPRQLVTEVSDAWAKVAKENNGFLHIVRTLHATNSLEKSATSEFLSLKEMNWLSDKAVVSYLLLDPDSYVEMKAPDKHSFSKMFEHLKWVFLRKRCVILPFYPTYEKLREYTLRQTVQ